MRRRIRRPPILLAFLAMAAFGLPSSSAAASPASPAEGAWLDRYARLLDRYTEAVDQKVGTRVAYRGLMLESEWATLIREVAALDPDQLKTREERLAFWINVYNIFAIDLIVHNMPVDSIKDIGSFFSPVWNKEAGRIGDRTYSLGEIEHEILRPLGEPRIHGAIVCASISCPNLLREPYRPATLDAQLSTSMRAWLARREKGLAIDKAFQKIELSPIFDWFEEDFEKSGGVLAVVTRYAPEADRAWLEANAATADVSYFDYDWGLNE